MKLIQKIIQISRTLLIPCCLLTSCNYLDVIPPAQADFDDTMKDEAATLNFLFTCYGYIPRVHPFEFKAFEQSADELISPKMWDDYQQQVAWGTISPSYYNSWGGDDMNICIDAILLHKFLQDTRIGSGNLTAFKPRQALIIHILGDGQRQTALTEPQPFNNGCIFFAFQKLILPHNAQVGHTASHGLGNIIITKKKHLDGKIRGLYQ